MDRTEASGEHSGDIDLVDIEPFSAQTNIVKAAIEQGLTRIWFVPDLSDPTNGIYVRIPTKLQFTYRCIECNNSVVALFLRSDVLKGRISKTKDCRECKGNMRLKFMGAMMDIPIIDTRKKDQGLERWIEE